MPCVDSMNKCHSCGHTLCEHEAGKTDCVAYIGDDGRECAYCEAWIDPDHPCCLECGKA
jgi:hypothetical protein